MNISISGISVYTTLMSDISKKFSPRSLEDTTSRRVWTTNVTRGDVMSDIVYNVKQNLNKYPSYYSPNVIRILSSSAAAQSPAAQSPATLSPATLSPPVSPK